MHAFQRRARHQRILSRYVEQRGGFHHQERSQALAAAEARIAHHIKEPCRPRPFAIDRGRREQAIEQRFRVLGNPSEPVLEDGIGVNGFFFRRIDSGHAFCPQSAYSKTYPRSCVRTRANPLS